MKFWTPGEGMGKINIIFPEHYIHHLDMYQYVGSRGSVPCYGNMDLSKRWDNCIICLSMLQSYITLYDVTTA